LKFPVDIVDIVGQHVSLTGCWLKWCNMLSSKQSGW